MYKVMKKVFGDGQKLDRFVICIRVHVVLLIALQCFVFQTLTVSAVGEESRYFYKLLNWFFAIMFSICYYRAAVAPIPTIPSIDSVTEDQYCGKCNNWKPMRARHCRMCDQ